MSVVVQLTSPWRLAVSQCMWTTDGGAVFLRCVYLEVQSGVSLPPPVPSRRSVRFDQVWQLPHWPDVLEQQRVCRGRPRVHEGSRLH
jgi:hypothetical protein